LRTMSVYNQLHIYHRVQYFRGHNTKFPHKTDSDATLPLFLFPTEQIWEPTSRTHFHHKNALPEFIRFILILIEKERQGGNRAHARLV
jgi:hypothetical protein